MGSHPPSAVCGLFALVVCLSTPPALAQGETPIKNLGANEALFVDHWLVTTVWETFVGEDLNGDGDTADEVIHVDDLSTGETTNLRLAAGESSLPFAISGDRLVFAVAEWRQGEDLNGDGDTADEVVHVHRLSSGETTNLRLAAFEISISEDWLVLWVSEFLRREDLNGDGDTLDSVVHVHNFSTGETTNLKLACSACVIAGDRLVLRVSEHKQGEDLNGDGDTLDDGVFHVHNLSTGETTNLRLAAYTFRVSADWLVLRVSEPKQGEDLNGDGDTLDDGVFHVHNLSTGETANLRLAASGFFTVSGDWLVLSGSEPQQAEDLNGDGDTLDSGVLHLHRLSTGQTTNLALAAGRYSVSADWLVLQVSEPRQAEDLNGDGDTLDEAIVHVHNLSTGETTSLRVAASRLVLSSPNRLPLVISGDWLVLPVSESGQQEDLNGDGDSEDDGVLHLHRLSTGQTSNLRLAADGFSVSEDWLLFGVSELSEGDDLNGDGDSEDDGVLHLHRLSTGQTSNLRLTGAFSISGDWLVLQVSEPRQGEDLNGDGDTRDSVVHVRQLSTGQTASLKLASSRLSISGDWLVLQVSEHEQGEDLNGDGDTRDFGRVVHLHQLSTGQTTNLRLASDRFLPSLSPASGFLLFHVSESRQRADLNGDGDTEEEVVHLLDLGALQSLPLFLRGDCDSDGKSSINDALLLLLSNFRGNVEPGCAAACDANTDGDTTGASDAVYLLTYLFLGGPAPGLPFPRCQRSVLATDTLLGCETEQMCR